MTPTLSAEAAERIRLRYPPPRVPRAVTVAMVAVLAAVGLGWLLWAAWVGSQPPVAARVSAFTVPDESRIQVTLTVQRSDPGRAATCVVQAQAEDFAVVGEASVPLRAGGQRLVDLPVTINTLRRATTASVQRCAVG